MVMAAYPLIIILRLFKAYSAQPRLAMVTKTLETAGQELVEFGLVFMSVFITFTISGVVLFGREVNSFATMPRAVFASFRMLIGDLMWDETSQVGKGFAFAWIALFMIMNVMLLLNMLLAIIMKHYVQAKDQSRNAQTLWSEAAQVFSRWRAERAGKVVPIGKILYVMEKEDRAEAARAAMQDEEDYRIEDVQELELKLLGRIMFTEDLQNSYKEMNKGGEVSDEQLLLLWEAAIEEYYSQNHNAVDMDEVLKLTHKVEHRVQKLNKMSKQFDKKNACPNEVLAYSRFLKDVEVFTDELRAECTSQKQEVEELRTLKRGLLLQLQTRQSLVAGTNNTEYDPTSVTHLLAHGDYVHYDWKLPSRYSDDLKKEPSGMPPRPDLDDHEDNEWIDDNVAGPKAVSTRQPRYAMDDPVSDDELHLDRVEI
jgi:hypothetical protein